jgi:hypothetical protein
MNKRWLLAMGWACTGGSAFAQYPGTVSGPYVSSPGMVSSGSISPGVVGAQPYGTDPTSQYVNNGPQPDPNAAPLQQPGYDSAYQGPGSVGSSEPLFRYDDQERWKHGYLHDMPYYEGYHSFRPYNYHHVFGQSTTAAGWGMPSVMPYSQQFWHRYEHMVDLSRGDHTPVAPPLRPPQEWDHYPKPIRPGASLAPLPNDGLQRMNAPGMMPPAPEMQTAPASLVSPASSQVGPTLPARPY